MRSRLSKETVGKSNEAPGAAIVAGWGGRQSTMDVPCQCLPSFPTEHPATVPSILSSAPIGFTERRMEAEGRRIRQRDKQGEGDGEQRCCRSNRGRGGGGEG